MKFSYVLPDPAAYRDWAEFEGDLACAKQAGYDAIELQIADPAAFDEPRVRQALQDAGLPMCAFQTGATYATRGNCLCTADNAVRERTVQLLMSFVDLAARWDAVIVVGSLQGRLKDEADRSVGEARIRDALRRVGEYALPKKATVAFEPVNHEEIGFHNTIGAAAALVRAIGLPSVRLMVDTFHMNIEERDMLAPLAGIEDILAHVHLSETNRDVLGDGHWDTPGFLAELRRIGYRGFCSIGVYNTRQSRRHCMTHCMKLVQPPATARTTVVPLDGAGWSMAIDPRNEGRERKWYANRPAGALPTQVPGVMQHHFPDYHGVAWYWREFTAPANPHAGGRYLLRFHAVDYLAEVWMNCVPLGLHEGSEEPFEFDATDAVRPDALNSLAVRVLNPTDEAIDGIRMSDVAVGRRQNGTPVDNAYNTGGITDSVELRVVPIVWIEDVHVTPNWVTGGLRVRANVRNAGARPVPGRVQMTVAPAVGGESLAADVREQDFAPGDGRVEAHLQVPHHRLWELNNPYLYRVTVRVQATGSPSADERSVRCGFRDFRFEDGYFRLNGRRIRLHGALHIILHYPGSMSVPYDEELVRRDVLHLKMMGFNSVRISCGAALPARQLDIFDEIGLLVCEEHLGADVNVGRGRMVETPLLEERWDNSMAGVIRRDRNHPCLVMWSLLNEVSDGRLFRHVVESLAWIRDLDDSRIVLLNSGRFDRDASIGSWSSPGSRTWEKLDLADVHWYPNFPHTADTIRAMRGLGSPAGTSAQSGDRPPMLLSEYGVCGAEDYPRFLRHFEQLGEENAGDAKVYRAKFDQFLAAWRKWRLDECWARPEDYFRDSQRNMATLVLDDFNAWMANPRLVGAFSSTQINDAWFHGCGVTNYFRELKPGMADAYADMGSRVRWCLFVEPVNVYRGTTVRCEAVLCNLDALKPGTYPVRVQVVGPKLGRVFDERLTVSVPKEKRKPEPPFAQLVFSRDVAIDGPGGRYRFLVDFERGAAAGGGQVEFFVGDPADMPDVGHEIALWGEDAGLERWLSDRGIAWRRLSDATPDSRQVILVSGAPPAPAGPQVFADLAHRIATGASVVFLTASTLAEGDPATGKYPYLLRWAPFPEAERPSLGLTPTWYFRADHWAKDHPIFSGLPSGGVMDYRFYRDIIGGQVLQGVPPPDEAVCGTLFTSGAGDFSSDLIVSVHRLDAGRFILNTLRIRENLGSVPAAERLLRNMLNHLAEASV